MRGRFSVFPFYPPRYILLPGPVVMQPCSLCHLQRPKRNLDSNRVTQHRYQNDDTTRLDEAKMTQTVFKRLSSFIQGNKRMICTYSRVSYRIWFHISSAGKPFCCHLTMGWSCCSWNQCSSEICSHLKADSCEKANVGLYVHRNH